MSENLEINIEPLQVLRQRYPTQESLYAHLISLSKPVLISMLLNPQPESIAVDDTNTKAPVASEDTLAVSTPANPAHISGDTTDQLAHCVYCHKVFNKAFNDPNIDICSIEHFGWLEYSGGRDSDIRTYTCCGRSCDYSEYEDYMEPPENQFIGPFCWQGKHREREICPEDFPPERQGDEEHADEDEDVDDYQYADGSVEELRDAEWWGNWPSSKYTCAKLKCAEIEARKRKRV